MAGVQLPTNSFQHSSQNEIISKRPRRAHSSPPLSASSQAATRRREEGRMRAEPTAAVVRACAWLSELESDRSGARRERVSEGGTVY